MPAKEEQEPLYVVFCSTADLPQVPAKLFLITDGPDLQMALESHSPHRSDMSSTSTPCSNI